MLLGDKLNYSYFRCTLYDRREYEVLILDNSWITKDAIFTSLLVRVEHKITREVTDLAAFVEQADVANNSRNLYSNYNLNS